MTRRELIAEGFERPRVSLAVIFASIVAGLNVISAIVSLAGTV